MNFFTRRRFWLLLAVVVAVGILNTGCGYLRNVRDDMMDVGTVAVGFTPPVIPGSEAADDRAVGPLPPTLGVYAEATEFLHLGALGKASGDAEWDRRGIGLVADDRVKLGLGPLHWGHINQQPYWVNAYKREGNSLDPWRRHMRNLRDPLFDASAKELIFRERYNEQRWMEKGWQDWETFSLEVAIPEPFLTHMGFYARVGVDPSQVFDAALSLFTIDLYGDAAYDFDGSLRFEGSESAQD